MFRVELKDKLISHSLSLDLQVNHIKGYLYSSINGVVVPISNQWLSLIPAQVHKRAFLPTCTGAVAENVTNADGSFFMSFGLSFNNLQIVASERCQKPLATINGTSNGVIPSGPAIVIELDQNVTSTGTAITTTGQAMSTTNAIAPSTTPGGGASTTKQVASTSAVTVAGTTQAGTTQAATTQAGSTQAGTTPQGGTTQTVLETTSIGTTVPPVTTTAGAPTTSITTAPAPSTTSFSASTTSASQTPSSTSQTAGLTQTTSSMTRTINGTPLWTPSVGGFGNDNNVNGNAGFTFSANGSIFYPAVIFSGAEVFLPTVPNSTVTADDYSLRAYFVAAVDASSGATIGPVGQMQKTGAPDADTDANGVYSMRIGSTDWIFTYGQTQSSTMFYHSFYSNNDKSYATGLPAGFFTVDNPDLASPRGYLLETDGTEWDNSGAIGSVDTILGVPSNDTIWIVGKTPWGKNSKLGTVALPIVGLADNCFVANYRVTTGTFRFGFSYGSAQVNQGGDTTNCKAVTVDPSSGALLIYSWSTSTVETMNITTSTGIILTSLDSADPGAATVKYGGNYLVKVTLDGTITVPDSRLFPIDASSRIFKLYPYAISVSPTNSSLLAVAGNLACQPCPSSPEYFDMGNGVQVRTGKSQSNTPFISTFSLTSNVFVNAQTMVKSWTTGSCDAWFTKATFSADGTALYGAGGAQQDTALYKYNVTSTSVDVNYGFVASFDPSSLSMNAFKSALNKPPNAIQAMYISGLAVQSGTVYISSSSKAYTNVSGVDFKPYGTSLTTTSNAWYAKLDSNLNLVTW